MTEDRIVTVTVPLRSLEAAINCLKTSTALLHQRARSSPPDESKRLRKLGDTADLEAEVLREAMHRAKSLR